MKGKNSMTVFNEMVGNWRNAPAEDKRKLRNVTLAVCVACVLLVPLIGVHAAASSWQPREGCGYTVNDTDDWRGLAYIARKTGNKATYWQIAEQSNVSNVNRIYVGQKLDVCAPAVNPDSKRPVLVSAERPDVGNRTGIDPAEVYLLNDLSPSPDTVKARKARLQIWAQAVQNTRPDWATDSMQRFLTAVSLPESQACHSSWLQNHGDASPPMWGKSVGCVQVRTFLREAELAKEPWRRESWLTESLENVAAAAWEIRRTNRMAWGPTYGKDRYGKVKMPIDQTCWNASKPATCERWWAEADAAIASIN